MRRGISNSAQNKGPQIVAPFRSFFFFFTLAFFTQPGVSQPVTSKICIDSVHPNMGTQQNRSCSVGHSDHSQVVMLEFSETQAAKVFPRKEGKFNKVQHGIQSPGLCVRFRNWGKKLCLIKMLIKKPRRFLQKSKVELPYNSAI